MLFHRPKPRSFRYIPKYYRKENDSERRIQFPRRTSYDPHRGGISIFALLMLIMLVVLLVSYLIPRLGTVKLDETRISVEDVMPLTSQEQQK